MGGDAHGRLFVSNNANASDPATVTWDRIDKATTPGRFISGISIDPSNPNHAWVSYSGYSAYTPDTPGHVFEVTTTRRRTRRRSPIARTTSATSR